MYIYINYIILKVIIQVISNYSIINELGKLAYQWIIWKHIDLCLYNESEIGCSKIYWKIYVRIHFRHNTLFTRYHPF